MTEHFRELSHRSRNALPRNRVEMGAWLIQKGGLGMIFLLLLVAVWWQGEKRTDEMRDLVKANVAAFQQVSADLQAQRTQASESGARMREAQGQIMDELRELRRRDPSSAQNTNGN